MSLVIYWIVSVVLVFIIVGILLILALGVLNLVFSIIAASKANEGEYWEYPLAIPFFN